jgi:CRP-like cAMP-binding protein
MTGGPADDNDTGWLAAIPLFEGMSTAELELLRRLGARVEVPPGEILVDQGDPGTYCYAVAEGTAGVFVSGEHVATVGPGSTIGEMALIDHRPRTATVRANDPMVLLRFDTRSFKSLLEDMPKASERIHAILASRLGE